jgi:hypothetical protein
LDCPGKSDATMLSRGADVRLLAKAVSSLRFATAVLSTSGLGLLAFRFSLPAEV